jgi:energy-coupling factor transporter ATP-binding protein EcfA2
VAELQIRGLTKRYGEVAALRGVDLEIAAGEFFVILGPSAAGKTTTLRTIAGLERPDAGTIAFDGQDVTHAPVQGRGMAMIFQTFGASTRRSWPFFGQNPSSFRGSPLTRHRGSLLEPAAGLSASVPGPSPNLARPSEPISFRVTSVRATQQSGPVAGPGVRLLVGGLLSWQGQTLEGAIGVRGGHHCRDLHGSRR